MDRVSKRVDLAISQLQTYSQNPSKGNSITFRLDMWRDSITIWKAHPLIGTGLGDFKNDRSQLFEEGRSRIDHKFSHAHSIYFDVLATAGLAGFLGLVIFMQVVPFLMFRSHWLKEDDPWIRFYALSGMATIIAFAVFGLTEGWLARNMFVRTYIISMLVFMSSIAIAREKTTE